MELFFEGFDPKRNALEESLFHTANGYLGLRACPEEGTPEGVPGIRGAYINAFYDDKPIRYGEKLYGFPETQQGIVNLTDVQTLRLFAGEEGFAPLETGTVLEYRRSLDMQAGQTARYMKWRSPKGKEIEVTIRRMVSLCEKGLFILSYTVRALNFEGDIRFEAVEEGEVFNFADPSDPRVAAEKMRHLFVRRVERTENGGFIESRTGASGLSLCAAVRYLPPAGFTLAVESDTHSIRAESAGRIGSGNSLCFVKLAAFADGRREQDPVSAALDTLERADRQGLAFYETKQKALLDDFWRASRVTVQGDERLQKSLDYSLYCLFCSAGRDSVSSMAAKGLSGEGYEGHYFWDTEIYVFPFFLLTDPGLAKSLLTYRHTILPKAREHARIMGHTSGALYPWRTISGSECSGYFPSGSAQYHLSADIAHAFMQYHEATGDVDFMAEKGAEVLVETARLFLDAGHWHEGSFRIDAVTGPDEYSCVVNNNFYTNAGAQETLRSAARIVALLKAQGKAGQVEKATHVTEEELKAFVLAADHMYLPYNEKLGIHAQDDAFLALDPLDLAAIPRDRFPLLLHYHPLWLYRHQVCKQADTVLAHYLYEDLADQDIMRRSYKYYERCTTHDSSLSACVFSIMAAKLGDMDKALHYFSLSATMDLDDAHGNSKDGIHTANMGGAYLGITAGFAGLRIKRDGLHLWPRVPETWQGYTFPMRYQNSRIEVAADHTGCRLTLTEGPAVTLYLYGQKIQIRHAVSVPLRRDEG